MVPGITTYCDNASGAPIVFEDVPAIIYDQCGYAGFPTETLRQLERLVAERPAPVRTVTVPVYRLMEAEQAAPATPDACTAVE